MAWRRRQREREGAGGGGGRGGERGGGGRPREGQGRRGGGCKEGAENEREGEGKSILLGTESRSNSYEQPANACEISGGGMNSDSDRQALMISFPTGNAGARVMQPLRLTFFSLLKWSPQMCDSVKFKSNIIVC